MSTGRKAIFSLAVTFAFFATFELGLAAAGYPTIFGREDPYLGFAGSSPLFVPMPDDDRAVGDPTLWQTAPNKRRFFNVQRFTGPKPDGVFRIFCVGGSSVHGHPYTHATSFCGWLHSFLAEADPSREWEVINAGGISYASYRVALLMEELRRHEPDLFIVYSAHNEFLEKRTYPALAQGPALAARLEALLSRTRTYSSLADLLRGRGEGPAPSGQYAMNAEVQTRLDGAIGPSAYTRDDALRERVLDHYRTNLERIIAIGRSSDADMLLATPTANLSGMSPFKSEPSPGLTPEAAALFLTAVERARAAHAAGRPVAASRACREALAIDDRRADLHFLCGHALLAQGEGERARAAFWRAVEEDVCPLRAFPVMRDIVLDVAAKRRAPVVDFGAVTEALAPGGIPGDGLFLDHVHPGVELHRALALATLQVMAEEGWVAPTPGWGEPAVERVSNAVRGRLDRRAQGIALRNLSIVLGYTGKFSESDRVALEAVKLAPGDGQAQYQAGLAHARAGDLKAATRRLRRARALRPKDPEIPNALGLVLLQRGKLEAAIAAFREVLALVPQHARAHHALGQVFALQGQPAKASAHYRRALAADPELSEAAESLAQMRAAPRPSVGRSGE